MTKYTLYRTILTYTFNPSALELECSDDLELEMNEINSETLIKVPEPIIKINNKNIITTDHYELFESDEKLESRYFTYAQIKKFFFDHAKL